MPLLVGEGGLGLRDPGAGPGASSHSPALLGGLKPSGQETAFLRFFLVILSPVSGPEANSADRSS